jgi:guanine nucleotide-binding protein subunit alpha
MTHCLTGNVENYDTAKNYFKKRFQRLNHKPDKRVYVHFTDATDTSLLQHVMMAVSDIILNDNLSSIMM